MADVIISDIQVTATGDHQPRQLKTWLKDAVDVVGKGDDTITGLKEFAKSPKLKGTIGQDLTAVTKGYVDSNFVDHASKHASNGIDELKPSDIGAQPVDGDKVLTDCNFESAEKTKLGTVEENAQENLIGSLFLGSEQLTPTEKAVSIPIAICSQYEYDHMASHDPNVFYFVKD